MKTAVLTTRPGETHPEPATLNASWTAEASRAGWTAEQFRQAIHLGPAGTGRSGHREQVLPSAGWPRDRPSLVEGPVPQRPLAPPRAIHRCGSLLVSNSSTLLRVALGGYLLKVARATPAREAKCARPWQGKR